jgi:hypothetical protein
MAILSMLVLLVVFFLMSLSLAKESAETLASARTTRTRKLRERHFVQLVRFPRKIEMCKSRFLDDEDGFSLN